ncbi:FimV/HubP family polar landmark protein [Chromobacterium vaccinii]|uniref:FimV/HubP family polar landmark protein n=1 Tax=Chromobacterium vaccinii TaxID=1108595 RepID=UPI000B040E46|nr:FimV/HubP family polar landmark protein [Chromobacterium vaccinii]
MRNQGKIKLGVLLIGLAYSACAWAGLGKIHVRSNLGELLKADIEMTGVQPTELDAVRVGLAGIETFQALNVDYASSLSSLRFALSPNTRGAMIRVSSTQPINDPYLRFVVEAKAPSGRSVREYTVLLDPANYTAQNIVQDVPSYADDDQASRYRQAAPAKLAPAASRELTVRQGATLRSLAAKVKPKGASLRQTMAALVQANPDAFADGDVSHPKPGATLQVPSARKMRALSASQVAGILGEPTPAAASSAGGQAAVPAGKGGDVLKLAPGDGSDSARLNDLQQQISSREKALQDATTRIAALEQQLKALQSSLQMPGAKLESIPPAAASAPPSALMAASAPHEAVAASAPKPAPKPVEKPHPKPPAAHPAPPPPSLMSRVLGYLPLIGGGVAGVGLLGLLGVMIARRRKGADENAGSAALGRSTVAGHDVNAASGSNSFMSNFTQAAGAIDAAEVDPVAEAEVYIAYGRDQQAEEILKDALQKDPSRHEVRMKLMEVYAARPDVANFERLAKEMHAAFDGKGALWAKAAALGRAIDPGNALYQADAGEPESAPATAGGEVIDLDQELFGDEAPAAIEAAPAPASPVAEEADPLAALFDAPPGGDAAPEPEANALDFDLDAMLTAEPEAGETKAPEPEANMLDFDFNLDAAPAVEAKPAEAPGATGLESLYEDMLAEEPSAAGGAQPADSAPNEAKAEGVSVMDDPLATKLDLAKVYLDMGDREGAREVLQDLLGEAQGQLKEEAQALLDKISA